MRKLVTCGMVLIVAGTVCGAGGPINPLFESESRLDGTGKIDRLVLADLRQLGIEPARVCSDSVFLRRVYLDTIGTLPTAKEARDFLIDSNPDKRQLLIDQLLDRPEFADYWAMKWGDVLRIKAEFPINLWPNAVQAYHHWIRASIRENLPYDQFVRGLLTASGSNFREPPVNFYRSMQSKDAAAIAQAVALTFMGARADKWPPERLAGMAKFFSHVGYKSTDEWKEEIVFFDVEKMAQDVSAKGSIVATFPDGTSVALTTARDPRKVFADWLIRPENPWFTRNIVNRIWFWLVGRGIIHEPDDVRPDNPPSNPQLLAMLEKEFVRSDYDAKALFRLILNSKTYQLSSLPRSSDPRAAAHFASYPLRRLDAEVLIDALCQITGTTEEYSSAIPEPFTFIPENQRSVALADGSITSSFLELFGRPPRDTGLEAERNNRPTAAQALHLLNSSHIQRKIERGPKLRQLTRYTRNPRQTVTAVYLTILSRFPTAEELSAVQQHAGTSRARGQEALVDLAWALINSSEFLYRH